MVQLCCFCSVNKQTVIEMIIKSYSLHWMDKIMETVVKDPPFFVKRELGNHLPEYSLYLSWNSFM